MIGNEWHIALASDIMSAFQGSFIQTAKWIKLFSPERTVLSFTYRPTHTGLMCEKEILRDSNGDRRRFPLDTLRGHRTVAWFDNTLRTVIIECAGIIHMTWSTRYSDSGMRGHRWRVSTTHPYGINHYGISFLNKLAVIQMYDDYTDWLYCISQNIFHIIDGKFPWKFVARSRVPA